MKALVMPGVDYSTQRVALPAAQIPAVAKDLKSVLAASKYTFASGVLKDTLAGDYAVPGGITGAEKPTLANIGVFGNKPAINFIRETAKRKALLGNIALSNKQYTMHLVYTNLSTIGVTISRVLFTFVSPLSGGVQKIFRFATSGPATKIRLTTTVSAGAFVPGTSTNLTSVNYDANIAATNAAKKIVSLVFDVTAGTIKVYDAGVFVETLTVTNLIEFTGQLYLGISPIAADEAGDSNAALAEMVMYDSAQSAEDINTVYTYLNAAFS